MDAAPSTGVMHGRWRGMFSEFMDAVPSGNEGNEVPVGWTGNEGNGFRATAFLHMRISSKGVAMSRYDVQRLMHTCWFLVGFPVLADTWGRGRWCRRENIAP